MKFKLKNSFVDYIIIGAVLVASVLFSIFFYMRPAQGNAVSLYISGEKVNTYSLAEDRIIELYMEDYPSLLGDMTIEIKDGRVRVSKEESPKHLCSRQGWISATGWLISCLPNDVYLIIEGESDFDTPPIGAKYYVGSVVYAS